jgi:hypothetical protein
MGIFVVTWTPLLRMNDAGKFLVIPGLILAALGVLLWSGVGKDWLGRLPGDVHYTRGNFGFSFPVVTCLLLSLLITFLVWLFRR